ncbi:MAG: TIR domain-containing protein [Pseudomonadota bacterium]|nr:TIR domain-containing protein [Pseudomonadota bacterium]
MPTPPERPFKLFLSYAHKNEINKDRLKPHLDTLVATGWVESWHDRLILVGDDWRARIEAAMASADVAVFLLDQHFLVSRFCMDVEIATLLQRHRDRGVLILFVLTDHCRWNRYPFIARFQLIPRDGRPANSFRPVSKAYTHIVNEIEAALDGHTAVGAGLPAIPATPSRTMEIAGKPAPTGLTALLEKLPGRTPHLFGRDDELRQLSEWLAHKGVFLWVAEGGMGKSALLRWWLESQDWPEGTRFLGHSFYSQGSHNQATSARSFLLDALKQLGVDHALDTPDDELGRLLAEAAKLQPTVLVLDGMEPLQQAAADPKLNGNVKDPGLAVLLENLARKPGQALCLASSRLPIPDGGIRDAAWFKEKELQTLPPAGALALLRQRGLKGTDAELAQVAERCGHHALALVLAAEFSHTYLQGQAAAFLERPWQPQPGAKHAATVMAWFDATLADEHQTLDRELAHILGLFDRPAPWGALLALKNHEPPIPGLTEQLHTADTTALLESLARLNQWGLLQADLSQPTPDLDAHPLVREHFGAWLEKEKPEAWRAAHSVLFDWFRALPEKEFPDTLEEMEPLYRAVGHGCKAGRYRTAREVVYQDRILRGEQGYSVFQLGAWSSILAALANFFPGGWEQPPVAAGSGQIGEALSEGERVWLMAQASFSLMSLSRLEESLELRRLERQAWPVSEDWNNFCISCNGLTDLLVLLGRWSEAETASREAETAAERIVDGEKRWLRRMEALAYLGSVLHGQGRLEDARAAFVCAEVLQVENMPEISTLYSLTGANYALLMLEQANQETVWREVLGRARSSLKLVQQGEHLLSEALDHCTIGLALSALGDPEAGAALNRAVDKMRQAGKVELQPPMHLARAAYLRSKYQLEPAWSDHAAALSIARRGNMRTYLAECALLAGNLHLDEGKTPQAAAEYTGAAQLIHEDGYGRRLTELHLLNARLLHAQHDHRAVDTLARAEARIREIGQWGFWRALRQVAIELGAADPGECPASA